MGVVTFDARHAEAVASGRKLCTIRPPRRGGWQYETGRRVHLYTGLRTKVARKLGEGVIEGVHPVALAPGEPIRVWIDNEEIRDADRLAFFAVEEGFADLGDLAQFFEAKRGLPFDGLLIRWRLVRSAE